MKDSVGQFRKSIGGFHRYDVIRYITKLAAERNEAIEANIETENKNQALIEAMAELHKRNVDICRDAAAIKAQKFSGVEGAAEKFLQLENEINQLLSEIDTAVAQTPPDIIRTAQLVGQILPIIKQSHRLIHEMQLSISGKSGAETDDDSAEKVESGSKRRRKRRKKNQIPDETELQGEAEPQNIS